MYQDMTPPCADSSHRKGNMHEELERDLHRVSSYPKQTVSHVEVKDASFFLMAK